MSKPIPVLYTHYGDDWIRGSETLLLDLLAALDKNIVQPVVWCNGAEMASACRAAGYPTYQNEFRYAFHYESQGASASHFFGLLRKGRKICDERNIQVLHANSGAPNQWLVPIGLGRKLPVIAHLHIDYLKRNRYVFLFHAATLLVGVSQQVLDGPLRDGVGKEHTQVIYNGIDFSRLVNKRTNLRSVLKIPEGATVIATAGSLISRKGHDILIKAFYALRALAIPSHLIIPSDGPERKALEELGASLGVADRVHFLGYIEDMTAVYRAADIFALASRGDAFGLVLAEAGHFGLPVVSTRVGGIPEVVADGQTGILTAPDDVPAFAAAMQQLVDDETLRQKMGTAAIARVQANFTAEKMAREFEQAYQRVVQFPRTRLGWVNAFKQVRRPYVNFIRRLRAASEVRYSS